MEDDGQVTVAELNSLLGVSEATVNSLHEDVGEAVEDLPGYVHAAIEHQNEGANTPKATEDPQTAAKETSPSATTRTGCGDFCLADQQDVVDQFAHPIEVHRLPGRVVFGFDCFQPSFDVGYKASNAIDVQRGITP